MNKQKNCAYSRNIIFGLLLCFVSATLITTIISIYQTIESAPTTSSAISAPNDTSVDTNHPKPERSSDQKMPKSESIDGAEYVSMNRQDIPALKGTTPPTLNIDPQSRLIVDSKLQSYLAYFAQIIGTEVNGLSMSKHLVTQDLSDKLSGDAQLHALDIVDKYWDYLDRYSQKTENSEELNQAKMNFEGRYDAESVALVAEFQHQLQTLRESLFSQDEIDGLFGNEINYNNFTMATLRGQANATALLSEKQQRNREKTNVLKDYKAFRNSSDTPSSLGNWHAELTARFGAEAANKLSEIEQNKRAWEIKKEHYFAKREQVRALGLTPDLEAQELDQIMQIELNFSELETRRIQAMENRLPLNS